MKLKQIFLFIILFNFIINQNQTDTDEKVINSCGIFNYSAPKKEEDCKDPNEEYCKFVNITNGSTNISFCAVIHGKYDDQDVWNEVKELINATDIKVLGSKYLIGKNPIFYLIFFYILIFLF